MQVSNLCAILLMMMTPLCAGKYTVLGQVIDGLDTLDKMEKVPVGAHSQLPSCMCLSMSAALSPMQAVTCAMLTLQAPRIGRRRRSG